MFCQVERAYIEDGFNLYGLRACVSNYSDCLDLILDRIGPEDSDDSHLTQSACTLYGLIHARYIVTTHGLDSMYNKVSVDVCCVGLFCHTIRSLPFISPHQSNRTPTRFISHPIVLLFPLFHFYFLRRTNNYIRLYKCTVCSKRVWDMPTRPMQRSTSVTRGPTR